MFSPGFNLGYNPFRRRMTDDDIVIPDSVLQKARAAGGEFIHKDGETAYRRHYDKLLESYAPDFESWFEYPDSKLLADEIIDLR